jgi:ribonucleoside-diphosphate reductase alpha chain
MDFRLTYHLQQDFNYDYFGFKTLERSYLLKINGKIVERPQHMLMRFCWDSDDLESVPYDLMLRNSHNHTYLMRNTKTSNVFLFPFMQDDSIDGIYDTLKQTAKISMQVE